MGRRQTIDREAVLNAAENVVSAHGASGLTIDAVAKAAGITKGGVQSCFGNKESMIEAMMIRWGTRYDNLIRMFTPDSDMPGDLLMAHLQTTMSDKDNNTSRSAVLLSALIQSPEYLGWVKEWYRERNNSFLSNHNDNNDSRRVAFLATEGLFFLRYFKLMELSNEEWERNENAIKSLLGR